MATERERQMRAAMDIAEAEDDAHEDPGAYFRPAPPSDSAGQVYSVRIPKDRIEQLRRVANELGEKPTTLMRRWVIERLAGVEPAKQVIQVVVSQSTIDAKDVRAHLLRTTVLENIDAAMADNVAMAERMLRPRGAE